MEYANLSPRQDEIKDVGGFNRWLYKNGRRIAGNVVKRQLVTLTQILRTEHLMTILIWYLVMFVMQFIQHKHTPEKPRLRCDPFGQSCAAGCVSGYCSRIADDIGRIF